MGKYTGYFHNVVMRDNVNEKTRGKTSSNLKMAQSYMKINGLKPEKNKFSTGVCCTFTSLVWIIVSVPN